MSGKNRLLGLEVVRVLAAVIVVFVHYHFLCDIGIKHALTSLTYYPFYNSLTFLYFLSEWSVRIFWCISGFIFTWKYQSLITDRTVNFWKFFVSRFARLYPLHVMTLCLIAIGQAVYARQTGFYFLNDVRYTPLFFASQLFMAGNRIFSADSFNWPVWSVSLEVSVYLLFFLVTRYFTKSIIFNLSIIFLFVVVRLTLPETPFMSLFECLLFFYIGGAASILKRYSLLKNFLSRWIWIGVGVIPLFFWLSGALSSSKTIFLFWTIWLPVLLYCVSDDFSVSAWMRMILETLGNLTYSSYLIHIPVQLFVAIICFRWKILLPLHNPFFLIAYVCCIFSLSYFVYRYFELPLKEAIKAQSITEANRIKPHHGVLFSFWIFVHLILAFSPLIFILDRQEMARSAAKSSHPIDYTESGRAFLAVGNYSEAVAAFKRAIARYPYDPEDYANLGLVYFKLGNHTEALAHFGKAIAINPNYYMVFNNRGVIYGAQGRYDLALRDFQKALELVPCPDLLKRGKERGRDLLVEEKVRCHESAQFYANLALIETLQGDYNRASIHLNQALERDPNLARLEILENIPGITFKNPMWKPQ